MSIPATKHTLVDLIPLVVLPPPETNLALDRIGCLDKSLHGHFFYAIECELAINRTLVSFQANKKQPGYRWFKYKEAFSAELVQFLLRQYGIKQGRLLDPFAGSGAALFASCALGLDADGIELLPTGQKIIKNRCYLQKKFNSTDFRVLLKWAEKKPWLRVKPQNGFAVLNITKGAYPPETEVKIKQYLTCIEKEPPLVREVLFFALLCILEMISYTRKDGQYLRWDHRSGRKQGSKPFDKGVIIDFDAAVSEKLREIHDDCLTEENGQDLFDTPINRGRIRLLPGSCLNIMPKMADHHYDVILTSPPYCNRYDYTRTYALELAMLNTNEKELMALRQEMLSCTVENRAKNLLEINPVWSSAIKVTDKQKLLQTILSYLETQKDIGLLNNNGIPRMVRGYFYEMACVIQECLRILKPNGMLFMVNDNVRYAGASISVDLILSDIAEKLGFTVEKILTLPQGKGNSSQQMGRHGREPLRKCVYVWRKA